jgi:hypothetical protein
MPTNVDEKHNRPALQSLLEKAVEYSQKRAEEMKTASEKLKPRALYAEPEVVKEALARAKRILAMSAEEVKDMPSPSKRTH